RSAPHRPATIVKHAQTGTPPLELARVCNAWARVPAGIANARARSLAAPIANREPQKSTGGGRKCSQLFPVEHEGGGGALCDPPYRPTGGNASRNLFALLKPQRYPSPPAWRWSNPSLSSQQP